MLACSCEVKCSMSMMSWEGVSNNLSRSRPMGWGWGCQNCYDFDAGCLEGGRYLDIVIWHVFMGTRCCCCTKHQAGWTGVPKCDVYQALGCFKKGGLPSLILKEPSGAWCCNRGWCLPWDGKVDELWVAIWVLFILWPVLGVIGASMRWQCWWACRCQLVPSGAALSKRLLPLHGQLPANQAHQQSVWKLSNTFKKIIFKIVSKTFNRLLPLNVLMMMVIIIILGRQALVA